MKKFAFSLQYLLDTHLAKEQAAEHALQTALAELRAAERRLAEARQIRTERSNALAATRGVVNRSDFAARTRDLAAIGQRLDTLGEERRAQEKRVDGCREELRKEMVARKVMENLRERERGEWIEAAQYEEQARMDETAVTRWSRGSAKK